MIPSGGEGVHEAELDLGATAAEISASKAYLVHSVNRSTFDLVDLLLVDQEVPAVGGCAPQPP